MQWVLQTIRPDQPQVLVHVPFDFETYLIRSGRTAPKLVCMSELVRPAAAPSYNPPELRHANFGREALFQRLFALLSDPTVLLSGANIGFDLAVAAAEFPVLLAMIFEKLEQNLVVCVEIAQRLVDIATNQLDGRYGADGTYIKHRYNLAALAQRYFGLSMDKDTWRLQYGKLWNVPLEQWEPGAVDYSIGDSVVGGAVLQAIIDPLSFGASVQHDSALRVFANAPERVGAELTLPDVFRQTRAQFWIALMVARGFMVRLKNVEKLKQLLERELEFVRGRLREAGLVDKNGKRDTKAAKARLEMVMKAQGLIPKMTPSGEIALDSDVCEDSGDALLMEYASYTSIKGILSKDVLALEQAAVAGMPIQSRFETVIHSGRMSSQGKAHKLGETFVTHTFQLHNVRKALGIERLVKFDPDIDKKIGVRQCFVPRAGYALVSIDFSMFELHGWGQVSIYLGVPLVKLIDALNRGDDVHIRLGARLLNTSYEEAFARKKDKDVKDARQASKPGNFGYPGGLGWAGFMGYAKSNYGMVIGPERAKEIKAAWTAEWEPQAYFALINQLTGGYGVNRGEAIHPISLRRRAWVSYTEAANGFFQGLAGDAKKEAGFRLSREMYTDQGSPLFGSYLLNDVHDEFLMEIPLDRLHEGAHRAADVMVAAARRWMPDCPPRAEPAAMLEWAKDAEAVYENGKLVPWRPPSWAEVTPSSQPEKT